VATNCERTGRVVPGLVMATEDMAIEELMMDSEERYGGI
jgi:hypothetical protein